MSAHQYVRAPQSGCAGELGSRTAPVAQQAHRGLAGAAGCLMVSVAVCLSVCLAVCLSVCLAGWLASWGPPGGGWMSGWLAGCQAHIQAVSVWLRSVVSDKEHRTA